jgi:hypothetical protein
MSPLCFLHLLLAQSLLSPSPTPTASPISEQSLYFRRSPPTAGNTASGISGFHPSSGSEYHPLAADSPWTTLFAATGGPSEIDAYIASSGYEHPLLAADIFWTDFITAIGGHSETDACIASAGNF